ncbi:MULTISPECIES: hypothetical protein [Haloferax]|uniref:DUF8106 domain-containing protein n=1 Tax=Haloferax marinum TaxID=2666143 RepID=A0A6A8GBD0_9EURY|nr:MULTISPECIES: hypothetical protein [Haloferax]KAB1198441.1 hypothetical protein Hfx1150_13320 [Haloferax sp. CBA1150]MRW97543.1 hypothetical protein [Haloferax marinum]
MNCPPHTFSADPPDTTRLKTVLFCQTCGRAAGIDDWPTQMDGERVHRIDCPDCGTTVWSGLDADDSDEQKRVLTPTA